MTSWFAGPSRAKIICVTSYRGAAQPHRTPAELALGVSLATVSELSPEDLALVTSFIDALVTKTRLKSSPAAADSWDQARLPAGFRYSLISSTRQSDNPAASMIAIMRSDTQIWRDASTQQSASRADPLTCSHKYSGCGTSP